MSWLKEILKDRNSKILLLVMVGLIALAVFLIFRYSSKSSDDSALNVIPADAAFIIEIRQLSEMKSELSENSGVWNELLNFEIFSDVNEGIILLDSVFTSNSCTSDLLADHSVYISMHTLDQGGGGILYATSLPSNCSETDAKDLVAAVAGENAVIADTETNNESFTQVTLPDERILYYAVSNEVFIASFCSEIVSDALKQQQSGTSVVLDNEFSKVMATSGKNVKANVYLNNNTFPRLFALLTNDETAKRISELAGFSGWAALDVSIQKDAFMLNGFASADTNGFMSTFSGQTPQEIKITEAIPASAAVFLSYGFSDFAKWQLAYKTYLSNNGLLSAHDTELEKLNKKYDADVEKEITTWIGDEMALVMTEPSDTDFSENLFLVIKAANTENVIKLLTSHTKSLEEKKAEKPKKETKSKKSKNKKTKDKTAEAAKKDADEKVEIKDDVIYEYTIPGVFPALFGKAFDGIKGKYFVIEGEYVIFGNSVQSLKNYVAEYSAETNLNNSNSYLAFSKNVSVQSNVFLYCDIRKSLGMFMKHANDSLAGFIGNNLLMFKNFDAFSYQFKASDDRLFYCNFCLKTSTVAVTENEALWSAELDTTIYGKPVMVQNLKGKPKNIIVFDDAGNMYMINAEGKTEWKIKLKEKPLGSVELIDADKTDSLYFLFNTKSYLYMVNCRGKVRKNFPVSLDDPATAALTLADYSGSEDYRIIVPCGKKLYNFQKDGSKTARWNVFTAKTDITTQVTYLKFSGTDCYGVKDKSGNIYIIDRKGKEHIELDDPPEGSVNSIFYLNAASGKQAACIVTTADDGKIIFILSSGKISVKSAAEMSAQHYFMSVDINSDTKKEFIFLDKSKLYFFDQDLKLLSTLSFPSDGSEPEFFGKVDEKNYLAVYCPKVSKIYVVGQDFSLKEGYPMSASVMCALGSLNNDNANNIIVGKGSTLYNYSFK